MSESSAPDRPELRRLLVGDRPEAWAAAGFTVDGDRTRLGRIEVRFVEVADTAEPAGVIGWELAGDGSVASIDGLATTWTDEPSPSPITHANGVSRLDHVVINTPDLPRTIGALEGAGFEVRRTRDVPGTDPVRRQVFLWAGETILEVVGRADDTPDTVGRADDTPATVGRADGAGGGDARPASVWGLALTTDDLDGAAERLAPAITPPKDAVQPGRRIATIDTRGLGIGPALALMSPHVRPDGRADTRADGVVG